MDIAELENNFALLDDWDERYRYLIELGKTLPPMAEEEKTPESRVTGCMSQVWLADASKEDIFDVSADADALIVRGLVAVLRVFFAGHPRADVLAMDPRPLFDRLGLAGHLSPSRSNGLWSMVQRIKVLAAR